MQPSSSARQIEHLIDPVQGRRYDDQDDDYTRIGNILDQIHEGEWWLIQMNGEIEWLCERVLQLQNKEEKRGAA